MRRFAIVVACVVLSAGCDQASSPNRIASDSSDATNSVSSGSVEFTHPTSLDELKETFTAAFDVGDKVAVEKMIYWANSSEKNRKGTRSFLADSAGKERVLQFQLGEKTKDLYRPDYKWTLASDKLLEIEIGKNGSSSTFDWPYGEIDGKYYLGAWDPEPKK